MALRERQGAPVAAGAGPQSWQSRLRWRRWSVVALVVAVVLAVPAVVSAWPVTPAEDVAPSALRDRVAASEDVAWSGYAEASAGLSLPSVAEFSDLTRVLTGTSRLRGWYAAPDRIRVDELYASGERSRYTTPDGQAIWDYGATLLTLVERDPEVRMPRSDDLLPPMLARRLLSGTGPDDEVSSLPARRVAGVAAAGFRVTVADPRTTVGALDVWADPRSGLPVAVEVRTKDSSGALAGGPIVVSAFSELDQAVPDDDVLTPRRGPGAGLTRSPSSDLFGVLGRGDPGAVPEVVDGVDREPPERGFGALGKYGTSLAQLIVVPLPPEIATSLLDNVDRAGSAGRSIAVDPPEGARGQDPTTSAGALESSLLSIAVVQVGDRAWAVSGLVPPDVLDRAAADVAAEA